MFYSSATLAAAIVAAAATSEVNGDNPTRWLYVAAGHND
jgi:hypothetical protein